MMQIEINEQNVGRQLADAGIGSDFEEQAVRLLLFHLCIAIDIYRHMTQAEKNKAGYWYRETLKNSFSLTGFLKERKRKRDKKKSPLHPSYKEESGVKENSQKTCVSVGRAQEWLEERKKAFWAELEKFIGKYNRQMVLRFFYYWAEEMKGLDMMRWEIQNSWNTSFRLAAWSKKSYNKDDEAAALRLERAKGKKSAPQAVNTQNTAEQKLVAAEREAANAQREAATEQAKAASISMEEYLKQNPNSILRTLKKHD